MRAILTLGLLVALTVAASAAPARHAKRQGHSRPQHVVVPAGQDVTPPARFAVPGWSDEATRRWLDNASAGVGRGG